MEPRGPSQLVEVLVDANGRGRVPFPDVQQLRSQGDLVIVIKGLRLVTAEVLTNGPITGATAAPIAELQKISLVLYAEGWEKAQILPVLILNDMTVPGGTFAYNRAHVSLDDWKAVDWSKSYLLFSSGTVSANAPYVVMFDVEYTRMNAVTKTEIIGPGING